MGKIVRKHWVLSLVILLIITSLIGLYVYSLHAKYKQTLRNISVHDEDDFKDLKDPLQSDKEKNRPFAILIFGLSERREIQDFGRSDTIMLALVDQENVKIQLISIPRDSLVYIPGHRMNKINAAYPIGGSKLMMETIENWLDIKLDGFVSINFKGFIDIVDLFGGIQVSVARRMEYNDPIDGTHIRLKPGVQVLDGKNALDFVRFRKSNDGRHSSDYDRMNRQQQALKALADKLTFTNSITKLYEILNITSKNVKTSLPPQQIDQLIRTFRTMSSQNLLTDSIRGEGYYNERTWYEKIPDDELQRIKNVISQFLEGQKEEIMEE